MRKQRLLDLCCGAGGAAKGYVDAGFEVFGVDIEPQPHYPYEFLQADALDVLDGIVTDKVLHRRRLNFDVIHASFPCQQWTVYNNCRPGHKPRWPDLVGPGRVLLQATGMPYVIENVAGAPLQGAVQLCGTAFGIRVRRHRYFESNMPLVGIPCDHGRFTDRPFPGSTNRPNGRTVCNIGEYRVPLRVQKEVMEIDWDVTLHELSEAIPPRYTEFIGRQVQDYLLSMQEAA